jgi:hypothetical protein
MTLAQLIREIEGAAMQHPAINMIVRNDIFRINHAPTLKYGAFAWTQGQHTGNINGMMTYNFTLFYIDRLKNDLSNQIEVQSVGCQTLDNILRILEQKDIEVTSYTLQPFNQRFTDECAGVFCNVSLGVPATTLCGESFGDYNQDFNDDFLIY